MLRLQLLAATFLTYLNLSLAAHTHIFGDIGRRLDVTCSDEKCDRKVNERLVGIIESFMNTDADPCEDFYKYACGNYLQASKYTSTTVQQEEDFNEIYAKIFDKWHEQVNDSKGEEIQLNAAYEKAFNYYSSCINEPVIKLNEFANNIEPAPQQKWPIFHDRSSLPWNFKNFVWWKVLAKLQSYDMTDVLLSVKVATDGTQRLNYAVALSNPTTEKLIKDIDTLSAMGKYTGLQIDILKYKLSVFEKNLQNVITEEEKGEAQTEEYIEKEQNISESDEGNKNGSSESNEETKHGTEKGSSESSSSESSEEDSPPTFLTLNELQSELPGIDWLEYFSILLQGYNTTLPNAKVFQISEDEKSSIKRIIKFLNESSKEAIALYLLAYFNEHVNSNLDVEPSINVCAGLLRNLMPLAVNHIYEDNYYGSIREESDAVIHNVFKRLTEKVSDLVESNNIDLTESEIEYLQRKSEKMRLIIGNLPDNKTKEFLIEYYAQVNITNATDFYHNHLELLHHKQLLNYRILSAYHENTKNVYETFDPVTDFDDSSSPYFLADRNLVVLPFAYLQMPLYHHKLHDVFQYAELGAATGHEIMHGFDKSGLWYDADGNYNKVGVGISEKKGFEAKLECLSRERTASIDERIADVAGVRLVMEAFFNDRTSKARKFNTNSTLLTNRQLFFVKLSQYFCDSVEVDEDKLDLSKMSHDVSNVRVIYTMSNTREFAHEFRCDFNTALKLDEVCQLW